MLEKHGAKSAANRLVCDVSDLMEVVLESQGRLQVQLTQSTLPRSDDLWYSDGADARRRNFHHRDEACLPNYIARWLSDDLDQREIVIGREVHRVWDNAPAVHRRNRRC